MKLVNYGYNRLKSLEKSVKIIKNIKNREIYTDFDKIIHKKGSKYAEF